MKKNSDAWLYEAFSRDTELPPSLETRLAQTCEAVRRESRGKETEMKLTRRNNIRTILLVAAALLVLSVSAYAVYQHTLEDAVLPEGPETAEEVIQVTAEAAPEPDGEPAADPGYAYAAADSNWLHMSLNGFSDSPEYKAYAEWNEWNDAWWAENPDPWAATGEDDTYFEGPENYARYYQACFTEQVEKLDAILEEYGLTAHTAICGIESVEDLCAVLGADRLVSDELPLQSGYMYDDGSFKIEGVDLEDDVWRDATVFFAVKGSFSQISGYMPADCEEWSYTAADGTEVLLALGRDAWAAEDQNQGSILAELEGGYVYASFGGLKDRVELEHYADGIAFAFLNGRFAPGADTSDITAAVEARQAEMNAAAAQAEADMYAPFADREERDTAVFDDLGHYTIGELPEGYAFRYDSAEWKSARLLLPWYVTGEDALGTITWGGSTWAGDDSDGISRFLNLSYQRYYSWNDLETVTNDSEFENAKTYYREHAAECAEASVNGCEALVLRDYEGAARYIVWFDTDRGLQFTLYGDGFDENGSVELFTDTELIAMAESVIEG